MAICHPEDVLSEQAPMDHGAMNINEEQVNDHIEEDDHTEDIVEDDSTNTLICDTFNVRMDDDDDNENDDFDYVHYLPLLEKAYEPLYEGCNTNLLSAILLIMNLKVMNGVSNIAITWMQRYVNNPSHI